LITTLWENHSRRKYLVSSIRGFSSSIGKTRADYVNKYLQIPDENQTGGSRSDPTAILFQHEGIHTPGA
jgi:hypothetical protein